MRNRSFSNTETLLEFAEMSLDERKLVEYVMYMNRMQGQGKFNLSGIHIVQRTAEEAGRALIWC